MATLTNDENIVKLEDDGGEIETPTPLTEVNDSPSPLNYDNAQPVTLIMNNSFTTTPYINIEPRDDSIADSGGGGVLGHLREIQNTKKVDLSAKNKRYLRAVQDSVHIQSLIDGQENYHSVVDKLNICDLNELNDELDDVYALVELDTSNQNSMNLRQYLCNFCKYSCKTIAEMQRHESSHLFQCKYCDFTSRKRVDLIRHLSDAHSDGSSAVYNAAIKSSKPTYLMQLNESTDPALESVLHSVDTLSNSFQSPDVKPVELFSSTATDSQQKRPHTRKRKQKGNSAANSTSKQQKIDASEHTSK